MRGKIQKNMFLANKCMVSASYLMDVSLSVVIIRISGTFLGEPLKQVRAQKKHFVVK
jgi:hypothetical protein